LVEGVVQPTSRGWSSHAAPEGDADRDFPESPGFGPSRPFPSNGEGNENCRTCPDRAVKQGECPILDAWPDGVKEGPDDGGNQEQLNAPEDSKDRSEQDPLTPKRRAPTRIPIKESHARSIPSSRQSPSDAELPGFGLFAQGSDSGQTGVDKNRGPAAVALATVSTMTPNQKVQAADWTAASTIQIARAIPTDAEMAIVRAIGRRRTVVPIPKPPSLHVGIFLL